MYEDFFLNFVSSYAYDTFSIIIGYILFLLVI
jgi:hypothetical protein